MKTDDIKSAAKDLGGTASKNADEAKKTLNDTASRFGAQAQDFAGQASDTANDLYGRARDSVRDAADGLPDGAADAVAAGKRSYDRGTAELSKRVAKQPIEALILAGAIGYLVGWATSRS